MYFALLITLLLSLNAHSAIDKILRTKADFGSFSVTETENVKLNTARVAMADYDLLAKDFSNLRRQQNENDFDWHARVDRWLVEQTGWIAIENAKQTDVNSPISFTNTSKTAYRPKGYGRAFVIPVEGGLIDAKGVGVSPGVVPTLKRAKMDGLATLGEVTREYLYEKLVEKLFAHANAPYKTVGSYAVLDFGFDVKHADGSASRAGAILRQSHIRSTGYNSSLPEDKGFAIEKLLRRYGITSSGETTKGNLYYLNGSTIEVKPGEKVPPGATAWDYINIQGTNNSKDTEVIDFGAYIAVASFSRDLRSPYDLGKVLMGPDSKDFVQPDEAIRLPLEQWGDFGVHDPKMDKPFIWSHELASAFASGRADRSAFDNHYNNLIGPVLKRWKDAK